ncbi:MAG: extracellular solute-binding protein [Streptosporangiales bacterium]|nr:extracellular solute-binding protein [Streptosporangiales bacterium]
MRTYLRRGRKRAVGVLLVAGVLAAAACSGGGGSGGGGEAGGKITLTIDTFGTFGYEELYKQYEASHPNIDIRPRNIVRLEDYLPRLEQYLATGSGAGDVVALEEGIINRLLAQPDAFVNLLDHGAGELEGNFLSWKWQAGMTPDGKLIGLGTDIGAMGMVYRKDLFEKAGLPTDREKVGQLWTTWDDFIETGKKFEAANVDAKFVDSATNVYNTILWQEAGKASNYTYFDTNNNLVIDTNPAVKTAWDTSVEMAQAGLSAELRTFDDPWISGFRRDSFATVAAPAWMLGQIQEFAGEEKAGLWDVTTVPGGGGVWGGSWLAVPAQSEHPAEAAELAKFLTNPQGQIAAFKARTNYPSSPQAIEDPAVQNFKNEYFSNAPVGEIFGESAKGLRPVYLAPDNQPVRERVEEALRAVEAGDLSSDAGWQRAVRDAQSEAG